MLDHLLALAVPICGVAIVILLQMPAEGRRKKPRIDPKRGDTSSTSQGDDLHRKGE